MWENRKSYDYNYDDRGRKKVKIGGKNYRVVMIQNREIKNKLSVELDVLWDYLVKIRCFLM